MIKSYIILTLATGAGLQFAVSYCRSFIAAAAECEVSSRTREMASIAEGAMRGEDFGKLLSLIRICPLRGNDTGKLAFTRLYFGVIGMVGMVSGAQSRMSRWAAQERARCAHFAAVMLDHRVLATVSASEDASYSSDPR